MHRVGDRVAEFEQRERALMREDGLFSPDCHPLLAHLVMLGGRKAAQSVEAPPHRLVASTARMVVQQLGADPVFSCLARGEVAVLLVRLGFQRSNIRPFGVMHKPSIALLTRTPARLF